jgi:molybdopterin synthase sulfur carrier subunit
MRILYFAWLREKIGLGAEEILLPPQVETVGALMAWLQARGPGYAAAFAGERLVRCAVDQEFATPGASIANATEIAFFPPVTGG